MTEYDKLVRDFIPDMIDLDGLECETRIVKKDELYTYLKKKLDEEVAEFYEADEVEELADIMEVLFAIAKLLGYTEDELVSTRRIKRKERGGFDEGIVLERILD